MGEIHAPNIIVRHRQKEGTLLRSQTIQRFWKNKETGTTVEVHRYMKDVTEGKFKVVFFDPDVDHELTLERSKFMEMHECIGNLTTKFK